MSVYYCHKHDRLVDSDYGECPECDQEEAEREDQTTKERALAEQSHKPNYPCPER